MVEAVRRSDEGDFNNIVAKPYNKNVNDVNITFTAPTGYYYSGLNTCIVITVRFLTNRTTARRKQQQQYPSLWRVVNIRYDDPSEIVRRRKMMSKKSTKNVWQ